MYGDHERLIQTYFSAFPGYYFTGDGARRDADGYYWITGRVDDVLNVSGHRMGTAEIGMWLAFAIAVCGAFGTFLGGYISDKMGQKDVRWFLWIPVLSFALSFPFAVGLLFQEDKTTALLFYLMPNVLYAFYIGPAYTLLQDLVEVRMRATANGIFLTFITLCGTGMGPFLVGYLSDALRRSGL